MLQLCLFLEHSGPEKAHTHPAAGPGYRPHLCATKQAPVCPQTPGGWGLSRPSAPSAKRARGTFRAIVTEKTDAKVGKGALFSRKCLNVSLCTVLLHCGPKLYIYGVLRKSEHACGVLRASALRSGLARLQGRLFAWHAACM